MRKSYIQPEAEILSIKSFEDFLALSPYNPSDTDDNDMGGSSGSIGDYDSPSIWGYPRLYVEDFLLIKFFY